MKEFPIAGCYDPCQVYQPEADTYLLLETVQGELQPSDRVLEMGTGTGYVGCHLTGYNFLLCADINPHACLTAKSRGLPVVRTDLFAGISGKFDLVVFNPPYLPTQDEERIVDWLEYALDGGPEGRSTIARFIDGVRSVLAPEGRVLLLISSLTGVDEVAGMFHEQAFKTAIIARKKIFDEWLFVMKGES
ncbi:MAG TPA: HemK2/MTQ2 family protein methyltransferase [Methanoregulaceae archaeon]|nr:HemK2/MTQ2 family protein methyltransferase [Methanoregulaceae archaeon]